MDQDYIKSLIMDVYASCKDPNIGYELPVSENYIQMEYSIVEDIAKVINSTSVVHNQSLDFIKDKMFDVLEVHFTDKDTNENKVEKLYFDISKNFKKFNF